MPVPHERHDQQLREQVGAAIRDGQKPIEVVRALANGTFGDWGEYVMPLPTARYYGQQAKKRHAAAGLTVRAQGDLDVAIESMARELLSEYDHELKRTRTAKTRDLDKLQAITKGLKDLRGLIGTGRTPTACASKPADEPIDPFLAGLTAKKTRPQTIRASSPSQTEKTSTQATPATQEGTQHNAPVPLAKPQNPTQVPFQATDERVYSGGTGAAWGGS